MVIQLQSKIDFLFISWDKHRDYLMAKVESLIMIEGKEILKSERIKAKQIISDLEKELEKLAEANIIKKQIEVQDENAYTVEYRKKLYKDLEKERLKNEAEKEKSRKADPYFIEDYNSKPLSVYRDDGEIRVCNQGKYQFFIDENTTKGYTTFELAVPKTLDTNKIKVDLNPLYIRVDVKGKITQWKFEHEIVLEDAIIQRSQITGFLLIKAKMLSGKNKINKNDMLKDMDKERRLKEFIERQNEEKNEVRKNKENRVKYYNTDKSNLKPFDLNDFEIINNKSSKSQTNSSNNTRVNNQTDCIDKKVLLKDGYNIITEVSNQETELSKEEKERIEQIKMKVEEIKKNHNIDDLPDLD